MPLSAQLEHSPDRQFRPRAQRLGQSDFRRQISQGVEGFFQRIHFHEPAFGAGAVFRRSRNEIFARDFATEPVEHAGFGDYDDVFC